MTRAAVTWLVQRPPPGDDSPTFGLLVRACNELGYAVEGIDVVAGEPPSLPELDGPVVVHGRKTLLAASRHDPVYRRAVFGDPTDFHPSAYQRGWGARMLNAEQRCATWEDALRAAEVAPVFVRPDDDDKLFTGAVFDAARLRALFDETQRRDPRSMTAPLVVAPVREIDAEARLFVVQSEIVGGSFYRPTADARLPSDLVAFAEEAIRAWQPHDVFVLDVARADGAYAVIEANGFNGSRFYASDVAAIVRRVSDYQAARW